MVDSNSEPDGIAYPVPGNDDASRAINLYCDLMVGAVLDGIQAEMVASGVDIGEIESLPEDFPDGRGDARGRRRRPSRRRSRCRGGPSAPAGNGADDAPAPTPSAEGVGVPGPEQPSRSGS